MADREKVINVSPPLTRATLFPKATGRGFTRGLSEAEAYKQERVADAVGETKPFFLALPEGI